MSGFLNLYEKLNPNDKDKLLISLIGLVFPSLIYFVINFPDKFFSEDIINILVYCITINIIIISVVTFGKLNVRILVISFYKKKAVELSKLQNKKYKKEYNLINKQKKNSDETNIEKESISILDKLKETNDEFHNIFIEFLDINIKSLISSSSLDYFVMAVLYSFIFNIYNIDNVAIVILFFIILNVILNLFFEFRNAKKQIKKMTNLIESCN